MLRISKGHTLRVPKIQLVRNDLFLCALCHTSNKPHILMQNNRSEPVFCACSYDVFHFHIHIIPRKVGDNIKAWPNFDGAKDGAKNRNKGYFRKNQYAVKTG